MTVEELKVRLCEEIKFTVVGYAKMCEVLEEFSEAQKTTHNSDYEQFCPNCYHVEKCYDLKTECEYFKKA